MNDGPIINFLGCIWTDHVQALLESKSVYADGLTMCRHGRNGRISFWNSSQMHSHTALIVALFGLLIKIDFV